MKTSTQLEINRAIKRMEKKNTNFLMAQLRQLRGYELFAAEKVLISRKAMEKHGDFAMTVKETKDPNVLRIYIA